MNWERLFSNLIEMYHMTFEQISNLTLVQLEALTLKGERTCTTEEIERWARKVREKNGDRTS